MPYIPREHLKYNLLPNSQKRNREVFEYDSELLDKIRSKVNNELVDPYGYSSYEQYYKIIDKLIKKYPKCKYELIEYKKSIKKLNNKHQWGIVKYIGKSNSYFINGRYYYCPIYKHKCSGIIDEEEFTAYDSFEAEVINGKETIVDFSQQFEIIVDYHNAVLNFLNSKKL